MKAVFVLALFVCLAVAIQAAPQLSGLFNAVQGIATLGSQVGAILNGIVQAGGATVQSLLGRLPTLLSNLTNATVMLLGVPQTLLPTVNGLLNNAVANISGILSNAGTTLTTLVPALGGVQTVLLTLVNNLAALNQPSLGTLQNTLSQVANTIGNVVGQISG